MRLWNNGKTMLKNGSQRFYDEKIYYADSNLFRVFTHKFIEGNAQTALVAPNSLVLTQSLAVKYFGNGGSYVGKTLENASGDSGETGNDIAASDALGLKRPLNVGVLASTHSVSAR